MWGPAQLVQEPKMSAVYPLRRFRRAPTDNVSLASLYRELLVGIAREGLVKLEAAMHDQRVERSGWGPVQSAHDHVGEAAIAEDELLDSFFESRLARGGRDEAIYWGEERPAPSVIAWRPGLMVFESDALDGSKPQRHLNSGYSAVLTAWRVARDGGLRQLSGVILDGSGTSVSWSTPEGLVVIERPPISPAAPARRYELRRGDIVQGDPKVLACVAARHDQRYKLEQLDGDVLTNLEATAYNQAGSPSTCHLLQADLGGVFELTSTTTWDAAGLIPLELAGGRVFHLDGTPRRILDEMEGLTELSAVRRRIEPYVAVSHPEALKTFLSAYKGR